jgi:hypothetical protein
MKTSTVGSSWTSPALASTRQETLENPEAAGEMQVVDEQRRSCLSLTNRIQHFVMVRRHPNRA